MNKLTCFKAYDIRGKLGIELNEEIAYRIGKAYAVHIKPREIVLGSDVRLSSNGLKLALAKGLIEQGVDVIDIGLAGTEEVYFATTALNVGGGIEVTASHNPIDYNGMKLVRENSKPISSDTGLDEIKCLAEENIFPKLNENEYGSYKKIDIKNDFVKKIISFIDINSLNKKLKVVINSGNGAAGHVIDAIENHFLKRNVPIELIKVNHIPDGNFPNGIPNPLLPERRSDTRDAVLLHKADLGIAFDGDFDRCFFFDENGDFIEGYYIVGLLAESFLTKNTGAKIIHDPRLCWNTIEVVTQNGGIPVQSKTGHAYIKERMREEDAIYGGEMSAHHYFKDFYYCDSGMIPWLLVIELISKMNKPLSQLVSEKIKKYPSSGEINLTVSDATRALDKVYQRYSNLSESIDRVDGYSFNFVDWRFNIRKSNTEPLIRLNVESRGDHELMMTKTNEILSFVSSQ